MPFSLGARSHPRDQQFLAAPVVIISVVILLLILINSLNPTLNQQSRIKAISTTVAGLIYSGLFYFLVLPRWGRTRLVRYGLTILHASAVGFLLFIQPIGLLQTPLLYAFIALLATMMVFGRKAGYLFTILVVMVYQGLRFFTPYAMNPDILSTTFLSIIAAVAVIESINAYILVLEKSRQRMKVMDTTARSLASTIETPAVISMLSSALQNAIDADTYFIGIVHENRIQAEFFYDDGEYYSGIDMPLENTLTGWVAKNRKTLSISNFLKEAPKMGVTPYLLGKPRISLSWLGAPIAAGGKLFGVVAVASYKTNTFSSQDSELLEFITQQAALALDNASHHNDVEQQSRLDSLTGVLNHRSFLEDLSPRIEDMLVMHEELSVIMLDIDHFKHYNDEFGHLVGDQVLELLTTTIRKYIKSSDLVGRWGGEEFIIALPHASGSQAYQVSQRIRRSLAAIKLSGRDGQTIPPPTVSQGIAVYPADGKEIFSLIDAADQRLYLAKERGRDQVEPSLEYWESEPFTENTIN